MLEAGESSSGIVNREAPAAGPEVLERVSEGAVVVDTGMLGHFEHHALGRHVGEQLGESGRCHRLWRKVDRKICSLGEKLGVRQSQPHRGKLELLPQVDRSRLLEPHVGGSRGLHRESSQGLYAGDAAVGEVGDGLEDHLDQSLLQHLQDSLSLLLLGPQSSRLGLLFLVQLSQLLRVEEGLSIPEVVCIHVFHHLDPMCSSITSRRLAALNGLATNPSAPSSIASRSRLL